MDKIFKKRILKTDILTNGNIIQLTETIIFDPISFPEKFSKFSVIIIAKGKYKHTVGIYESWGEALDNYDIFYKDDNIYGKEEKNKNLGGK